MTKIILVRHCEAYGNHMRIFQGHTDSEISEKGKEQLELLALRLRNTEIDALYSSPLKRARLTAEAVNQYHHLPLQIEEGLFEINGGEWEGKSWEQFPQISPEQASFWNVSPHKFAAPGGETMQQVYDRIWNAIMGIVEKNPQKTVCIASHGCAIRNFLCKASGWPIERLNEVEWCDNTAISIIEFDEALCPKIMIMNDATHLTEDSSTFSKQNWWKPENRGKDVFS